MQTTARAPKYRKSKSSLCALFVIILIFVVIVYTIGRMTEHPFLHIHAEKASKMKKNKYGSANSLKILSALVHTPRGTLSNRHSGDEDKESSYSYSSAFTEEDIDSDVIVNVPQNGPVYRSKRNSDLTFDLSSYTSSFDSQDSMKSSRTNGRRSNAISWIKQFCNADGNEFYIEIPLSFIEDPVTIASISDHMETCLVDEAIKLITDSDFNTIGLSEEKINQISIVAKDLYNLIHSRYLLTYEGLKAIKLKYGKGLYGQCPRVFCRGQSLIPVGMHDKPGRSLVKCFCYKCRDIYHPIALQHRKIDGVAFGTTLPHLLLQRFPELAVVKPSEKYEARIYGFQLHNSTYELRKFYGDS